ncbi:kinase-like domain-containing protein [Fomitopsis serialis]|uniref:kinase-like domain-containing protein n=1 Tax=Fomitopsis serialis TaxID=139415 RepID=UPI0020081398|nr:kinase-like domain-containing protein [Neoantrodia serialis]KAH9912072.1 kinase-like domain-containing protein [Neoantrodia serialis]
MGPPHPSLAHEDDDLEELARLGEGAGGTIYKVRVKRTGQIIARKTITTLEAPMKQLMREIKITLSTSHHNIVRSLGAYLSPSSSEVKSAGKRLKETDKHVAENVAGRMAEGLINSMAGTFTSTSPYMAPDQLSGHEYTIRSDVWTMGISLLELVQNRFPFPSDLAVIELTMYITQYEPPELEDEGPFTYSAEMNEFIKLAYVSRRHPHPHPWIKNVMQHEADMAIWIRKVLPAWPKSRSSGEM